MSDIVFKSPKSVCQQIVHQTAMTIPERRRSRLQKYRITQRGVQRLAERMQSK